MTPFSLPPIKFLSILNEIWPTPGSSSEALSGSRKFLLEKNYLQVIRSYCTWAQNYLLQLKQLLHIRNLLFCYCLSSSHATNQMDQGCVSNMVPNAYNYNLLTFVGLFA